jgi:hypothetical protein
MTTPKQIEKQLELMTSVSIDPVDVPTLQEECDKTCEKVMGFLKDLKENAEYAQDVLNDVSSELEELVMDEHAQKLLGRLDKVIDWVFDLTKE